MSEVRREKLTKRGGGFPYKWQEREFVLFPDKIEYYAGAEKKGTVDITAASTVEAAESEKPRAFRLTSGPDVLLMCGNSDAHTIGWIADVQGVIDKLKGENGTPAAVSTSEVKSEKATSDADVKTVDTKNQGEDEREKEEADKKAKSEEAAKKSKEVKEKKGKEEADKKAKSEEAAKKAKEAKEAKAAAESAEDQEKVDPHEFADKYDMGPKTLMSSQGKTVGAKFGEILSLFTDDSVQPQVKRYLSKQLGVWGSVAAAAMKSKKVKEFQKEIFELIVALALCDPEDVDTSDDDDKYQGVVLCADEISKMIMMMCMQDQKLAALFAPSAYDALKDILDAELPLNKEGVFVKPNASTHRAQACCNLSRIMPYQGTVKIPSAMDTIARILVGDDYPDNMKADAKSALSTVMMVNKQCMKTAGPAIMELIATGDHDTLIMTFAQNTDMYLHDPAAVHKHLEYILGMTYNTVCSLLHTIAGKFPRELIPYFDTLLEKLEEESAMGAVTLMIIKEVAEVDPNLAFSKLDRIIELGSQIPNSETGLAMVIGAAGKATVPKDAADQVLPHIAKGLEGSSGAFAAVWLQQINNLCGFFSKKEVLSPYMEIIKKHKSSSDIMVTSIIDFHAGRSLAKVAKKVDELDAKVNAMNKRVEESCKSYEDVIKYVDKNIADVKDFVGEIVKKLPLPKRLEVVGTVRKTLILHFECVRTGREFPITSNEWNKWLKMGFSLAKSGKAIFDIGTGNPLGLLSTGAECVKGIYEAYKSEDDDEFNTYMNQPFLTSAEQDGLIEKLRAQGFFEKMSYDAQKGGWYLNNPEQDGTAPDGEKGSVTKVKSKKGVGVTEGLVAGATALASEIDPDMVDAVSGTLEAAGQIKEVAEEVSPKGCCTIS